MGFWDIVFAVVVANLIIKLPLALLAAIAENWNNKK